MTGVADIKNPCLMTMQTRMFEFSLASLNNNIILHWFVANDEEIKDDENNDGAVADEVTVEILQTKVDITNDQLKSCYLCTFKKHYLLIFFSSSTS